MPDKHDCIRTLPFTLLAAELGLDIDRFRRSRDEWVGPCPIHQSKTNNNCFRYAVDGKFHCFSCHAKGRGAIDLVKAVRSIGFEAAVAFLEPISRKAPPPTKKEPIEAPMASDGVLKPYTGKYEKFKVPCPWLEARLPDVAVREDYGLFCYNNPARKSAYSGRVMIPVKDVEGTLYGYLGRAIEGDPKYLFPRGLPKTQFVFGAHEVLSGRFGQAPVRILYLVESPFAVVKFASLGLPAVSPFGWSLSPEQLELLTTLSRGVVYLPDRNKYRECGDVARDVASRLWLRCPPLPEGIDDPEQLTHEQILALIH